ncbi:MAG: asparaginase [Actinobacteria bacterium]|nr:asparaginase [Actinomycetota bacterium]
MNDTRPVALVAVGGTIAMGAQKDGLVAPARRAGAIARGAAFVATADFRPHPVPSPHLTLDDCVELAAIVQEHLDADRGVVVATGTDTLEEVAFSLELQVRGPVVVTGSMRAPDAPGSDADANVLAAWTVAATVPADIGVTVVLADEVHSAGRARKLDSASVSAFSSGSAGLVGRVAEGALVLLNRPATAWPRIAACAPVPAVALVTAAIGDDAAWAEHVEAAGYRGVVYEAFGGGHWHPAAGARLAVLASRLPVVVTTRTANGPLFRATYDFPGSERDLLRAGVLFADGLDGAKARVLVALALSAGISPASFLRRQRPCDDELVDRVGEFPG